MAVVPALGFFGALSDWTAAVLAAGRDRIDVVEVAYALTDWIPTPGTLAAAAALAGGRWVHANGATHLRTDRSPIVEHRHGPPFGVQPTLAEYPGPEPVLLPRHLTVDDVHVRMGLPGLQRVLSGTTANPAEVGANRSQGFLLDVAVIAEGRTGRASLRGRDIYRTTAPVITHTLRHVLASPDRPSGVLTPAQAVHPADALTARADRGVTVAVHPPTP